ncbi:MAG TPA: M23/M56 family metallopeptidase [Asticcacaulis sp.]|nr:M23/M56 family metallopeptidase [Asticcacaulis sp.]
MLVVLLVPFLWSAGVTALKRIPSLGKSPQYLDDKTEKRHLALMIAPVFVGLAVALAGRFVPMHLPLPALPHTQVNDAVNMPIAPAAVTVTGKVYVNWMPLAAVVCLIVYGVGLTIQAARLLSGLTRLRRLASTSQPTSDWGEDVRLTTTVASPLALGRATILLPERLLHWLSPAQTQLILRHEREHLKRGDSRWFIVLAVIDAIFWFNPFVRLQTQNCRLAAELACDAAAIASSPEMRGTYAEALVRVLKHAAGDLRQYAPTAFSPVTSGDYRMRISEIMRVPGTLRKPRILVAAVAAALVVPVGLAQFAWSQSQSAAQTPAVAPVAPKPAPGGLTTVPIDAPMTSPFGLRKDPENGQAKFHAGVDFDAPIGTAVKAAGDGTVSAVYASMNYGEVVEIDHGGLLMTRYAHLGTQIAKVGDKVVAGQQIATSGGTGVASLPPHLHFEVWKNNRPINPVTVLSLPKAN